MASNTAPAEAPPSYAESQGTGASTASQPSRPSRLEVPSIPAAHRKSMEDEARPLPEGWIRQFDTRENHQFFVNTKTNPPRSIWVHPYDDEEYLSTLSSEERERIQEEEARLRRPVSPSSIDEKSPKKDSHQSHAAFAELPPRPGGPGRVHSTDAGKKKGLGERLKEKATGMTKEEREVEKRKRAQEEQQYYEMHMKYRTAMSRAVQTGQPQFFTKDKDGHDIYVEPPQMNRPYGGYNYGGGGRSYGVNPYGTGIYANPNARFVRPQAAYGRPMGPYGGGYGRYGGGGMGMGMPLAGGLLGGMMLGSVLF